MQNQEQEFSHVYAVILAGGSGTRFWPTSRQKRPKQLCDIGNRGLTMIERTLKRLDGFIPPERRLIVTRDVQADATRKIVGDSCPTIVAEPEARNTAAALTLAALEIIAMHGENPKKPILVSLHADHLIEGEEEFRSDLKAAVRAAEGDVLTLVGIRPTYPATGFGYIEAAGDVCNDGVAKKVARFIEKPVLAVAEDFIKRGGFFWNAGYFIWKVDVFCEELAQYLPDTLTKLKDLLGGVAPSQTKDLAGLKACYESLLKISVDNAILEKSQRVAVVPSGFGWLDVGSWDALDSCMTKDEKGNILAADSVAIDSKNCTIVADQMFVGVIGMEGVVVVQAGNAILVCPKDKAQDVKYIVEFLEKNKRQALL